LNTRKSGNYVKGYVRMANKIYRFLYKRLNQVNKYNGTFLDTQESDAKIILQCN
jgi:hypothetical protein